MSSQVINPYRFASPVASGQYEFIDTQTSTGNDFTEFTFADAVDFSAYSEMYCTFAFGATSSRDVNVQVGSSSESGVLTDTTYDGVRSDNTAGSQSNETGSNDNQWYMGTHARVATQNGVSGHFRIYLVRNSSDETFLAGQGLAQGADSLFWTGVINTTTDAPDLKYFRIFVGADVLVSGSNISCYKVRSS